MIFIYFILIYSVLNYIRIALTLVVIEVSYLIELPPDVPLGETAVVVLLFYPDV